MLNEAAMAFSWLTYKKLDISIEGQVIKGENAKVAHVLNVLGFPNARALGTDSVGEGEGSDGGAEDVSDTQDQISAEREEDDSEESDSGDEDSRNGADDVVDWLTI